VEKTLEAPRSSTPRISPEQLIFFNRQLASMARLNMPIAKGLRILAREVDDAAFKALIEDIQHDLDEGLPLQEALAKHPETFSNLYIEILKAGESTGNLAVILDELTAHSESMLRVKNRIREAVLYPVVISVVIASFVIFFLVVVAPQFEDMLYKAHAGVSESGEDASLPAITTLLFSASNFVRTPWLSIPFFAAIVGAIVYLVQRLRVMGDRYEEMLFKMPLFGRIFHLATLMKVTRTMRDLLLNGVSMVQTLRLVKSTAGDNRVARKLETLLEAVEEGGSFSRNLASPEAGPSERTYLETAFGVRGGRANEVFPDTMVWKLQMAEEKGIVESALAELATEFEAEIEERTTIITKLLSPLLLVVMASIVFLMFLAAFVPLTQMYPS
jgi:type IV pilus assembly protein PilC